MSGNKGRFSAEMADGNTQTARSSCPKRGSIHRQPQAPGIDADAYYRELYVTEPDFRQMGRDDPAFGKLLHSGYLDFNDPTSVMQLTKTLLNLDFGLQLDLPNDRLCPPVPNRHNYILWLKRLMDSTSYQQPGRRLFALDIGTGASCIYPLLGCTQRPWYFVATDIDAKNLTYAKRNVELNGLQGKIKIVDRNASDTLLPLDDLNIDSIDFSMTNPPFYLSEEELLASAKQKSRPPFSACTGATVEMVTEGGETAFVGRIIEESLAVRGRVQWYTSMLGKQSSIEVLVQKLHAKGINNYAITEFIQGNKTRRWGIAWSFAGMRPAQDAARGLKGVAWKKLLPPVVEIEVVNLPLIPSIGKLVDDLIHIFSALELLSWEWDRESLRGIGRARENVWSRAWRRKKMREQQGEEPPSEHIDDGDSAAFGFCVSVQVQKAARSNISVGCRWVEGHDAGLFESFVGFLRTRLKASTETSEGQQGTAERAQ